MWIDLVGSPPGFDNSICERMNNRPDEGIAWKGRVLFHI